MITSINPKVLLPVLASAFILVACDRDKEDTPSSRVLSSQDTLLQYVPADTPYVFANVAPLSDELMDKLEPKIERVLQSYQTVLREVMKQAREDVSEDEFSSEEQERITAVANQLMTLLSVEGMRNAGLGREATGAIYGNGLLPVVRLELTDGALFDKAIADLEGEAGYELPVATLGDYNYRYLDVEEFRFVIAVLDNQAVITLVPAGFDDAQTSQALGITLPDSSIAQSGALQSVADEYGFTDQFVGFFDVASIVDRLTGGATGVDADLVAMMDHDPSELSDVCRSEIRSLAAISPRLVMGYKEISVDKIDSAIVLELRDDIAAGLQGLSAAVPGLGNDRGGLMSFGMSLDIKAAREFVITRLDAMEAEPFECELFAEMQAGVAGGREALNQPIPPMVYDFRGFVAVIDDIEGLDIATQTPPTSVDGSFLLAMNNAPALVSLGTMFSPEIAELNLQPDGKPVALQLPQTQALGIEAFAALGDDAIAISVGDTAAAELEGMITAAAADEAPLLSFSMDAARYYEFLGAAIAAGDSDSEKAPSPEMQAALEEIMQAVADVYDRMSADVRLTARGVEIESSVILKD